MDHFPLLDLSTEVQSLVVGHVAKKSFEDLYRLRATCNTMRRLADDPAVYWWYDLFKYTWYDNRRNSMLMACYEQGNLSAVYIKGVEVFYRLDRQDEGLSLIKRAADGGYDRAMCTYAMTRKVFWYDGEYLSRLTREFVYIIGTQVTTREWGWDREHNLPFLLKRDIFIKSFLPTFYDCQCSPTLDRDWDLWFIEYCKGEEMCSNCFWIQSVGLFLRSFKPCTGFPDFDTWRQRANYMKCHDKWFLITGV